MSYGFPQLGNLFKPKTEEIHLTICSVQSMLKQRQQDLDFRRKIQEKIMRVENDKSSLQQKIQLLTREKISLNQELGKFQNQISTLKQQIQASTEKLKAHKEESKQSSIKVDQKIVQLIHEAKKKERNFLKLQEQVSFEYLLFYLFQS